MDELLRLLLGSGEVTGAVIAGRDGIVLASQPENYAVAAQSAVMTALFDTAARFARHLDIGTLEYLSLETGTHGIAVMLAGDFLLATSFPRNANRGSIRLQMNRVAHSLAEARR